MNNNTSTAAKAIFAAGCFWGVEQAFQAQKGVVETTVGFTGGSTQNPTYRQVCSGETGHAEAVEIMFDPAAASFETLAKHFFEIHNPALISNTSGKRSQYRSAIFYLNEEQKAVAMELVRQLREKGIDVRTAIIPATHFYRAEAYHQQYYKKKGKVYEAARFKPVW